MKALALASAVASAVAGCASTAPQQDAPTAHDHAHADSLLALPPDSLSAAEWEWLRLYEQRRTRDDTDRSIRQARGVGTLALLVVAAGAVATGYILLRTTPGN